MKGVRSSVWKSNNLFVYLLPKKKDVNVLPRNANIICICAKDREDEIKIRTSLVAINQAAREA